MRHRITAEQIATAKDWTRLVPRNCWIFYQGRKVLDIRNGLVTLQNRNSPFSRTVPLRGLVFDVLYIG